MESQKLRAAGLLQHNDYTVGWVCALPKELIAATAMLDERHKDREQHLKKQPNDINTYTLGSIGGHNIVIACLPKGKIGTNSAATVAASMVNTFPAIRFGLMVGIGGSVSRHVRLGDVVVSTPSGTHPGVVQWDMGKAGCRFERTGPLNNPPSILLTALTKLEAEHAFEGSKVPEYLEAVGERNPRLGTKYQRSHLVDRLFKSSYRHASKLRGSDDEDDNCQQCETAQIIEREPREMMVHYGTIASGNQVIKDAQTRDELSSSLGRNILCVEMEAAGLMDNFPCIVIRGICDYADSHKNDSWQDHAAAVAAAFAKEFLGYIQASEVEGERTVQETLDTVCNGISAIRADMAYTTMMLRNKGDLEEVLNWLSPMTYGPQHSDHLQRRQPGTGQWFLESKNYQQWLSKPAQALFCHGMPGAGKTILASIIINDLESRLLDSDSATVIYIYLNFKRKDEQNIQGLLLNLLKQLVQTRPSLPKAVTDLHKKHGPRQTMPMINEINLALVSVMAEYSRVYVVIDALDEYQASVSSRKWLLSILSDLQAKTCMNLLITARSIPDIWEHFQRERYPNLEIRASENDIRTYARSHVSKLGSFVTMTQDLKELVIDRIAKSAEGMFLVAQLYLESLKDKDTTKAVRQALKRMSAPSSSAQSTYARAYEETMARITGQLASYVQRARQVLGWIIYAERPLKKVELQHALGVELGQTTLDPENLPEISHLVSLCAGLVIIDERSSIIRLVHYTAQEYFDSTKQQWFPEFQQTIAATCASYLSFPVFANGPRRSLGEMNQRLYDYPFYDYAATHWGDHARESPKSQTCEAVLQFLQKEYEVESADQARRIHQQHEDWNWMSVAYKRRGRLVKRTGLHLAAVFRLEKTVHELLHIFDIDARDRWETTALELAVMNNDLATVRALAEKGADLLSQTRALLTASRRGYLEVARYLAGNESLSIAVPETAKTWLSCSKNGPFRKAWKHLVQRCADVNSEDPEGEIPLHFVIARGDCMAIKLLIEQGADVNETDSLGRTPLQVAVEEWDTSPWAVKRNDDLWIVGYLLRKGARVDSQDFEGWTALAIAKSKGDGRAVQLLTEYSDQGWAQEVQFPSRFSYQ